MLDLLDARLYALTHRGNAGDVAHYVRLCRGAGSVLELGAGAGRMLTALAKPGREVWGLELDPHLMKLGQTAIRQLPPSSRSSVSLVAGDMRRFKLPRRFERVILPYNGLYCLLSVAAAAGCMRSAYAALEPGGIFAFDVWHADPIHEQGLTAELQDEERLRFEHAGRTWRVFESCVAARGAQRLDVTYTYAPSGRALPRVQCIRQRYYRVSELVSLLTDSGFRVRSLHGTFSGSRLSKDSSRVVVTAVRD
jgi:SAM-dependent methyltransferase